MGGDWEGDTSPDLHRDTELEELFALYVERLNRGEKLHRQEVLARHPRVGEELLQCLEEYVDSEPASNGDPGEPLGTLGDYTLRRQIGRGGMGVVFEAWQNSMDRRVALKVLPAGLAADQRAFSRFMREAKTAGLLDHQNIVSVHAAGFDDNTPYYAMDYVEGKTLAQILAKLKEVELESETPFGKKDSVVYFGRLAEAFADVTDGLQHAHSKGVIHRDMKPSNLILDPEGRLRILDFGLARLEGQESLTLPGDFVGTPLYMSPEQARRRKIPIDRRTDVYSLGATLYEAICGRPPFRGRDHADTLSQILERDPAQPRTLNTRVPKDFETIVLKCLEKDASHRYGTAEALGQDLRRFVRGDPIEARPQRRSVRVLRWLGYHRVALTTGTVVLLLLIGVVWLLRRQDQEAYLRADAEYGPVVREAAMLVLRSRLSDRATTTDRVSMGPLPIGPALPLTPEDFRPATQGETDLKRVAVQLERMTDALPNRPEAHYFLAYAHALLGQRNEAKAIPEDSPQIVQQFMPMRLLQAKLELRSELGVDEATERAAKEILENSPKLASWERSWLEAQLASLGGNWEATARAFDEILASTEEPFVGASLWAQLERGIARLELEDFRGAIDDFYRTWAGWPELMEPALLLGKAYYRSGDPEGAEYIFKRLHDGMPGPARQAAATWISAVYGQLENRVKELEWAAHVDGSLESRLRCWPALWGGRYEEAVDCFQEARRRHPEDVNVLSGLGFSLGFATEGRRGSRRADQVTELREVAGKLVDLVVSRSEGKPDLSLAAHVCFILTLAFRRQDDLEGAVAAIESFRADGEYHPLIDVAHASVLNDRGEFKAAEDVFPALVNPTVVARVVLGRALEGQGRYEDATNEYRRAIEQVPSNGHGYSQLARVLLAEGKAKEATVACRMAIDRFPRNTSAHETLALALLESGRPEEALEVTRIGIEQICDRPDLHVVRAQVLVRLGRFSEAVTSLCEALVLHPRHEEAQDTLRKLIENRLENLTPDVRKKALEILTEKLGRTDSAEIRAILGLLDEKR